MNETNLQIALVSLLDKTLYASPTILKFSSASSLLFGFLSG
jgi:hypothetical protein